MLLFGRKEGHLAYKYSRSYTCQNLSFRGFKKNLRNFGKWHVERKLKVFYFQIHGR